MIEFPYRQLLSEREAVGVVALRVSHAPVNGRPVQSQKYIFFGLNNSKIPQSWNYPWYDATSVMTFVWSPQWLGSRLSYQSHIVAEWSFPMDGEIRTEHFDGSYGLYTIKYGGMLRDE